GQRIDVRVVDEMGAAIERHAEALLFDDAASTDPVRRLDQDEAAVGFAEPPRRRDPGGAGADHDAVDLARRQAGALGERRTNRERSLGAGQEASAGRSTHGSKFIGSQFMVCNWFYAAPR